MFWSANIVLTNSTCSFTFTLIFSTNLSNGYAWFSKACKVRCFTSFKKSLKGLSPEGQFLIASVLTNIPMMEWSSACSRAITGVPTTMSSLQLNLCNNTTYIANKNIKRVTPSSCANCFINSVFSGVSSKS